MTTQPATDVENLKRSREHLWQRPCANTTSISVAKVQPLRPDAESTSEHILACIENLQIHKFAEFLGQLSCQKGNTSTRIMKRSDRMLSGLPSSPHATILRDVRFVRAPHSDGIPPVNLLVLWRDRTPRLSTSSEVGSCLGSSPANR